jgi:hypothetical protein
MSNEPWPGTAVPSHFYLIERVGDITLIRGKKINLP